MLSHQDTLTALDSQTVGLANGYSRSVDEARTLVVTAKRETAESLVAVLDGVDTPSHTSVKRNLDGDAATWIVVATLGGQALPHVLSFLQSAVGGRRVKKVKWGDLEIENPSKEDLERFRAMLDQTIDKSDGAGQDTPPAHP